MSPRSQRQIMNQDNRATRSPQEYRRPEAAHLCDICRPILAGEGRRPQIRRPQPKGESPRGPMAGTQPETRRPRALGSQAQHSPLLDEASYPAGGKSPAPQSPHPKTVRQHPPHFSTV